MLHSSTLALLTFAALISSSLAAPTPIAHTTSLVARGRAKQDVSNAYWKSKSPRDPTTFQEEVDSHLAAIQPDLGQKFKDWKLDLTADYQLCEDWSQISPNYYGFSQALDGFDSTVALALIKAGRRKDIVMPGMNMPINNYIRWIASRLILLQRDLRVDVYKLLTEWSIALHKEAGFPYTPYPAGIGAVFVQIQTVESWSFKQWRDATGDDENSPPPVQKKADNTALITLHQLLSKKLNFSNLQLLCLAVLEDREFKIGNRLPTGDGKISYYQQLEEDRKQSLSS